MVRKRLWCAFWGHVLRFHDEQALIWTCSCGEVSKTDIQIEEEFEERRKDDEANRYFGDVGYP
jgi:hypothetical protein